MDIGVAKYLHKFFLGRAAGWHWEVVTSTPCSVSQHWHNPLSLAHSFRASPYNGSQSSQGVVTALFIHSREGKKLEMFLFPGWL